MGVLVGDITADGVVNSTDVNRGPITIRPAGNGSNFRDDVKVDGVINRHDVNMVESRSGTACEWPVSTKITKPTETQPHG